MAVFLLYARRLLRRPFVLLVALIMPLLMVQAIVLQYHNATSFSVSVSVPDSTLHQFVVGELKRASVGHSDVAVGKRSGASGVLISIDATVADIAGHPDQLRAAVSYQQRNSNNALLAARMDGIVSTIAYLAGNATQPQQLTTVLRTFTSQQAPVTSRTTVIGNVNNTVLVASFNMIVFIVLLLTMSTILTFVRDKRSTTSQRILVATHSRLTYYAQLVLLFAAVGVFEFLIMVASMVWLFKVPLGLAWGRVLVLGAGYLLFNVFAIALGLLLVSCTTKESAGRLLVTSVTLPMAMLGGALWPLSIMPHWMQNIAEVLPTTWLTQLNGVLFSGFPLSAWSMARPLLLLVGVIVLFFGALSRVPSERI